MEINDFINFVRKEKLLFINEKDNYDEAMVGQIVKASESKVEVLWYYFDTSKKSKGIKEYKIDKFYSEVTPFLIINSNRIFTLQEHIEIQQKLNNWYLVINKLYNSAQHRLKIKDCIYEVVECLGVTPEIASSIIKTFIGRNILIYTSFKSGTYISLSNETLEIENKKRYLSSISSEIRSKSERINYVISHGQTVGNYRENLFISVLKKYIPTKFHIATGFVEGSNKQIDIIIYDQHNYLPVFREDDLVVVKKESVIAVIEIKTTLDQNTLINSLEGISEISNAGMNSIPFFKGIFAFNSKLKNEIVSKNIIKFYKENPIDTIHGHLDVICVPGLNSQFIDYNNLENTKNSCPTLCEIESTKGIDIAECIFFQKLFSFLEVEKSAKRINERYFDGLFNTANIKSTTILTEEDWIPMHTFYSEWETTSHLNLETQFDKVMQIYIQNVKKRLIDVKKWNKGEISKDELIKNYN